MTANNNFDKGRYVSVAVHINKYFKYDISIYYDIQ